MCWSLILSSQEHNRYNVAVRFIHLPLAASKWSSRLHRLGFIRFWTLSLLLPPVSSRSVGSDSFRRTVVASVSTGVLDRDPRTTNFAPRFVFSGRAASIFVVEAGKATNSCWHTVFAKVSDLQKHVVVSLFVRYALVVNLQNATALRILRCMVTSGTTLRYTFWPIFQWIRI